MQLSHDKIHRKKKHTVYKKPSSTGFYSRSYFTEILDDGLAKVVSNKIKHTTRRIQRYATTYVKFCKTRINTGIIKLHSQFWPATIDLHICERKMCGVRKIIDCEKFLRQKSLPDLSSPTPFIRVYVLQIHNKIQAIFSN